MRRYAAWGLLALGLSSAACAQLPFFNTATTAPSQVTAKKTPTPNRDPIIKSLTAHRFVTATESVALWVQASDPDCDPLKVTWSITEGLLSSTVGTDVTLTSTATRSEPYIITAQVSVSDGRGGTAQGSLNIQVGADGNPMMATEATASLPTPEPCTTPTPEPTPVPSSPSGSNGTPSSSPTPTPTPVPTPSIVTFRITNSGLVPSSATVRAGQPVAWQLDQGDSFWLDFEGDERFITRGPYDPPGALTQAYTISQAGTFRFTVRAYSKSFSGTLKVNP